MQRLKSRAQFQAVLAGNTVARSPHFALHQLVLPAHVQSDVPHAPLAVPAETPTPPLLFPHQTVWLGAMVPKRWAKRAVTRNAIKRQIYVLANQFAPAMQHLPVSAYVLRLRSGFDKKQFVSASSDALKLAVRTELQQLLTRLVGTVHTNSRGINSLAASSDGATA